MGSCCSISTSEDGPGPRPRHSILNSTAGRTLGGADGIAGVAETHTSGLRSSSGGGGGGVKGSGGAAAAAAAAQEARIQAGAAAAVSP